MKQYGLMVLSLGLLVGTGIAQVSEKPAPKVKATAPITPVSTNAVNPTNDQERIKAAIEATRERVEVMKARRQRYEESEFARRQREAAGSTNRTESAP